MIVEEAQREIRTVYLGGFPGSIVSGLLWLVSAALATWVSPAHGIVALAAGGVFIFPATQLLLKAMGRRASLDAANPLRHLAMQIAFTVPLGLPLVGAATLYRLEWFYPAFAIVVGAHYLPFTFLYGMRHFAALAAILVTTGLAVGLYLPGSFSAAGWLVGATLVAFAFVGRSAALR
jgi:hypothetical protein